MDDFPPGRGSGTPPTLPVGGGDREPIPVMAVVREVCARLPPPDPSRRWELPRGPTPLERFLETLGPRHREARLDNFRPTTPEAEKALWAVRAYAERLEENLSRGVGILLFGPSGTGKDHLLVALAKLALAAGKWVRRVTGPELFRLMRDAMADGEESARLEGLKYPPVLILSDPLPPVGVLTAYQAAVLYELVDHRWQNRLPVWCSLNVASSQEADQRLGAAIVDRLQDGALVIRCVWPSFRRPGSVT